jgi:hypothetical protein
MRSAGMTELIEAATEMHLLRATSIDVKVTTIEADKMEKQVISLQRVRFTKVCSYRIEFSSLVPFDFDQ